MEYLPYFTILSALNSLQSHTQQARLGKTAWYFEIFLLYEVRFNQELFLETMYVNGTNIFFTDPYWFQLKESESLAWVCKS